MALDSISNALREIMSRLDRLEGRSHDPVPVRVTGPDSVTLNPTVRPTYADRTSRPPGAPSGVRHPAQGRVNSTHHNRGHSWVRTGRPTVTSTNRDFWLMINMIFNLVRLERHRTIWTRMPTKVGQALGDFVGMISPPLPDLSWTESMCSLEKDIVTAVLRKTN